MLPLLDTMAKSSYYIPLEIVEDKDPYVLAAYIAALRHSTRFNEATGSIVQYLRWLGYNPNLRIGGTNDRMRTALARLAGLRILDIRAAEVRSFRPNESFCIPFGSHWGWSQTLYPVGALFKIGEINTACRRSREKQWGSHDGLMYVLQLVARLRLQMETTVETISPSQRWNDAMAIVNFDDWVRYFGISERKLLLRLDRARITGFGDAKRIDLRGPTQAESQRILIFANRVKGAPNKAVFRKAKNNLAEFYSNCDLIER